MDLLELEQVEAERLDGLDHESVQLGVRCVVGVLVADVGGEVGEVLVQRLARADVLARFGVAGRARGQLALLEHERDEREEWMPRFSFARRGRVSDWNHFFA